MSPGLGLRKNRICEGRRHNRDLTNFDLSGRGWENFVQMVVAQIERTGERRGGEERE